jgi:phosphoribosylformimino-5-aminoimidazole carboxamide ribotide isomerase
VFNRDPAAQAQAFEAQGFERLHVVDLDGAFAGGSVNAPAVEAILKRVSLPIQLGGGIRDMASLERWFAAGVSRAILGTAAVRDPDFVRAAARAFPGRVAVGVDARDGFVAVEGWAELSQVSAVELGLRFGVAALIYTDISRDGALRGLNIEATLALARAVAIPVVASGGLASIADVRRLLEPDCGVLEGAIAGRALYDGRLDAAEALETIRRSQGGARAQA